MSQFCMLANISWVSLVSRSRYWKSWNRLVGAFRKQMSLEKAPKLDVDRSMAPHLIAIFCVEVRHWVAALPFLCHERTRLWRGSLGMARLRLVPPWDQSPSDSRPGPVGHNCSNFNKNNHIFHIFLSISTVCIFLSISMDCFLWILLVTKQFYHHPSGKNTPAARGHPSTWASRNQQSCAK